MTTHPGVHSVCLNISSCQEESAGRRGQIPVITHHHMQKQQERAAKALNKFICIAAWLLCAATAPVRMNSLSRWPVEQDWSCLAGRRFAESASLCTKHLLLHRSWKAGQGCIYVTGCSLATPHTERYINHTRLPLEWHVHAYEVCGADVAAVGEVSDIFSCSSSLSVTSHGCSLALWTDWPTYASETLRQEWRQQGWN